VLAEFLKLNEGPDHDPHTRLRQIGWLGHTGETYPWWETPTAEQEPGGYMPLYIELGDD
jgi:hypothetical protein